MMEREKIIKEYERFVHEYVPVCTSEDYELELHMAVLALLKEQREQKTGHWTVLDFCANEGIYCSECHMKIFDRITKPKKKLSQYCPHCGSRNDQFFRDGEVVFR